MYGERLKKRRKELKLSADAVAKLLDTTRVTVSRWETGVSEPNDKTKIALARILKTSVAYLMGEVDNSSSEKSPRKSTPTEHALIIQTNDPSRKIYTEPSDLNFDNGEVKISMPDTPENKKLFDKLLAQVMRFNRKNRQIPLPILD